jgi:hypothetical protein
LCIGSIRLALLANGVVEETDTGAKVMDYVWRFSAAFNGINSTLPGNIVYMACYFIGYNRSGDLDHRVV